MHSYDSLSILLLLHVSTYTRHYHIPPKKLHELFSVTQQVTETLPDDNVCTLKHVGAVEWTNKLSEACVC
jgi:hypothetical protein